MQLFKNDRHFLFAYEILYLKSHPAGFILLQDAVDGHNGGSGVGGRGSGSGTLSLGGAGSGGKGGGVTSDRAQDTRPHRLRELSRIRTTAKNEDQSEEGGSECEKISSV